MVARQLFLRGNRILICLFCATAILLADTSGAETREGIAAQNEFFSVTFYPEVGGAAVIIDKETQKRLSSIDFDSQTYPGGLLEAKLWYPRYLSFGSTRATQEVAEKADSTQVSFFTQGSGSVEGWLHLKRTFTIPKKLPMIVCVEEIENQPSSMMNITAGLWLRNVVGDLSSNNVYLCPTMKRIERQKTMVNANEFNGNFYYDPSAGWAAVVAESGLGVGMSFELGKLDCVYQFSGSEPGNLEWGYRAVNLSPGEKFNAAYRIFPFKGLKSVDYVCDIGAVVLEEGADGKIRLGGYAAVNGNIDVTINASIQKLSLEAGKMWHGDFVEKTDKTKVVILFQQKEVANFVKSFSADTVVAADYDKPKIGLGKKDLTAAASKTNIALQPITAEVCTPHFKWGKPLPGGPIRLLAITDYVHEREVAELCQRFDFEAAPSVGMPFMINDVMSTFVEFTTSLEQRQHALLKLLKEKKWDVILLAGIDFDRQFNSDIRKEITRSVQDGCGLVAISAMGDWPEEPKLLLAQGAKWIKEQLPLGGAGKVSLSKPHYLTNALDWDAWANVRPIIYPTVRGEALLRGGDNAPILIAEASGKGRVVSWLYNTVVGKPSWGASGVTPADGQKFPEVEYEFAAIGKSIIWAAGREVQYAGISVIGCASEGTKLTISAACFLDAGKRAEVECALVTANNAKIWEQKKMLDGGNTTQAVFQVPRPEAAGSNFIHLRLRDESGNVLDWGYKKIRSEKGYALALASDGEPHKVVLKISHNGGDSVAGINTTLSAYDSKNTILDTYEAKSDRDGVVEWILPEHFWGRRWLIVKGSADGSDGCAIDQVSCRIGRHERDPVKPQLASWSFPGSNFTMPYLSDFYFDAFGDGIDGMVNWGSKADNKNAYNNAVRAFDRGVSVCPLYWGAEIHVDDFIANRKTFLSTNDDMCLIRKPSLADSAFIGKALDATKKMTEVYKKFHPMLYVAGDEMSMSYYHEYFDYDFHPQAIEYFHDWLRQKRSRLEDANLVWGTSFKSWEDVRPETLGQAKKRGVFSLWNDFRTCMEDLLADYYRKIAQGIKAADPAGDFAISGTQRPGAGNGVDWWKLSQPQTLQGVLAYSGFGSNNMRWSFSNGKLKAFPFNAGYCVTGLAESSRIWQAALEQSHGLGMFDLYYITASGAYKPSIAQALAYVSEWRRGYWELLYNAKRKTDVGIYYSQNSLHLSRTIGKEDAFMEELDGWLRFISDMGYAYKFVSYAQAEGGHLIDEGVKILVLPQTLSLSETEAAAIVEFAEKGGCVLTSGACGTFDEDLKPREKSALRAIFGFDIAMEDRSAVMAMKENGSESLSVNQNSAVKGDIGPDVMPLFRDSRNLLPLLAFSKAKQGRGIWLGFKVSQFNFDLSNDQMLGRWRTMMGQISAKLPVKPLYTPGNSFIGQVYSYVSGSAEIVGIVADKDKCQTEVSSCSIDIPNGKQPLLVKENGLVGSLEQKNGKVNIFLKKGGGCLIAFTPEQWNGAGLAIKATEKNGEVSWQMSCENHVLSAPVLSLNLLAPSGQEVRHKVLVVEDGKTTLAGKEFIAPQEPVGQWNLEICDILTGKKASTSFEKRK